MLKSVFLVRYDPELRSHINEGSFSSQLNDGHHFNTMVGITVAFVRL